MKEKILILEDEIGIRSFVSINLKREGYEVIEAGCGQEAIDKIKNEKNISLALLDVMLPDMSGIEVCTIQPEISERRSTLQLRLRRWWRRSNQRYAGESETSGKRSPGYAENQDVYCKRILPCSG